MTTAPVPRWRSTSAIWQTSLRRSIATSPSSTGEVGLQRPRRRLVLDDADHPHAHLVGALRRGDVEIPGLQLLAELHRVLGARCG